MDRSKHNKKVGRKHHRIAQKNKRKKKKISSKSILELEKSKKNGIQNVFLCCLLFAKFNIKITIFVLKTNYARNQQETLIILD